MILFETANTKTSSFFIRLRESDDQMQLHHYFNSLNFNFFLDS